MIDSTSHDQVEQLLPAAALEILEGDELLLVTAHVSECADCARLLDSYRESVAALATTFPERLLPSARSARIRDRLLARAAAHPSGSGSVESRIRRARVVVDRWAGWAVAAGLAGVLLFHHSIHRPVAYGWLVAGVLILLALALGVYIRIQRTRLLELEERLSALSHRVGADQPQSLPSDQKAG